MQQFAREYPLGTGLPSSPGPADPSQLPVAFADRGDFAHDAAEGAGGIEEEVDVDVALAYALDDHMHDWDVDHADMQMGDSEGDGMALVAVPGDEADDGMGLPPLLSCADAEEIIAETEKQQPGHCSPPSASPSAPVSALPPPYTQADSRLSQTSAGEPSASQAAPFGYLQPTTHSAQQQQHQQQQQQQPSQEPAEDHSLPMEEPTSEGGPSVQEERRAAETVAPAPTTQGIPRSPPPVVVHTPPSKTLPSTRTEDAPSLLPSVAVSATHSYSASVSLAGGTHTGGVQKVLAYAARMGGAAGKKREAERPVRRPVSRFVEETSFFERQEMWSVRKQQKQLDRVKRKDEKELEACSFQPFRVPLQFSNQGGTQRPPARPATFKVNVSQLLQRLAEPKRQYIQVVDRCQIAQSHLTKRRENTEVDRYCTFHPNILPSQRKVPALHSNLQKRDEQEDTAQPLLQRPITLSLPPSPEPSPPTSPSPPRANVEVVDGGKKGARVLFGWRKDAAARSAALSESYRERRRHQAMSDAVKECTFTPKVKEPPAEMVMARSYLRLHPVTRLTEFTPSRSKRPDSAPPRGKGGGPPEGQGDGGDGDMMPGEASRSTATYSEDEAQKIFFGFLYRQNVHEHLRMKRLQHLAKQGQPSHKPTISQVSQRVASRRSHQWRQWAAQTGLTKKQPELKPPPPDTIALAPFWGSDKGRDVSPPPPRLGHMDRLQLEAVRVQWKKRREEARLREADADWFAPTINRMSQARGERGVVSMSYGDRLRREQKLMERRAAQERLVDQQLSFVPELNASRHKAHSSLTDLRRVKTASRYMERLQKEQCIRNKAAETFRRQRDEQEVRECSFHPKVRRLPEYIRRMARGYRLARDSSAQPPLPSRNCGHSPFTSPFARAAGYSASARGVSPSTPCKAAPSPSSSPQRRRDDVGVSNRPPPTAAPPAAGGGGGGGGDHEDVDILVDILVNGHQEGRDAAIDLDALTRPGR
ncbi:unnamed protein product [Vitrella brassicaformis CCMP3155]|uniref:Uncharacterized protein n=2 Tax=Vitrella brassicaformis TaxID=1169539 RepID=A0A0G4EEN5_VITBC|nr:unnamed protein product [Vitrella brassicaformis CCMP3155]|eukprot:CEL93837.1 unnamed protein product [Vitrella brassicaformis CCMP3155]